MNSKNAKVSAHKIKGTWGGSRAGAGRPKTSPFVAHLARPELGSKQPARVTLKLRANLPSLRLSELFIAFEKGALRARRFGLRIIEYSVLDRAIHLVCEAHDKQELERSFKSLNTTLAIAVKKEQKRLTGIEHKGPVFLGRFEMRLLTTPAETKAGLKEVLTAAAGGADPTKAPRGTDLFRDVYSSSVLFDKWKVLLGEECPPHLREPADVPPAARATAVRITALPQFWLTKTGWRQG